MTFQSQRKSSAFTLAELLVGVAVFSFVMAGFTMLYYRQSRSADRINQKTDLADQARSAYFRMTEEIKFGIDLMHPIIGSAPTPYLLFTNSKYELIAYWVETYTPSARSNVTARRLMRLNFNAPGPRKSEMVAPFVDQVLFSRRANRLVDVQFAFLDAKNNHLGMSTSICCRNAVAVY